MRIVALLSRLVSSWWTKALARSGCGAPRADAVEHYVFCQAVQGTARRHLRLDIGALRALWQPTIEFGMGLGALGDRPTQLEGARRFPLVVNTLRQCAADRASADEAAPV